MMTPPRFGLALIGVLLACVTGAQAQKYPDRTVSIIVPFAAGGLTDVPARVLGAMLPEKLGQNVVVENKTGGTGTLGVAYVARSAPDGYTLLILSSTYTINSAVMSHLPFDPKASFIPVAMLGMAPFLLATSKRLPVANAQELIALARARPGELNYGSAGIGSVNHMAM